jgi:hypothetical protein
VAPKSIFGSERVSAGIRHSRLADLHRFSRLDLLACQGVASPRLRRPATVLTPKPRAREQRLCRAIAALGREHRQCAALLATEMRRHHPKEFPESRVLRACAILKDGSGRCTNVLYILNTLDEARAIIPHSRINVGRFEQELG